MKAIKNGGVNGKNMGMLPGMVASFKETVESSIKEIKAAGEEIKECMPKIDEARKKCKDKKAVTPADHYVAAGKPIECTKEAEKKWKASRKKAKKGKGKAKGKKK